MKVKPSPVLVIDSGGSDSENAPVTFSIECSGCEEVVAVRVATGAPANSKEHEKEIILRAKEDTELWREHLRKVHHIE